jgi:hypothetical protein
MLARLSEAATVEVSVLLPVPPFDSVNALIVGRVVSTRKLRAALAWLVLPAASVAVTV